jgi:hypothetical protein
MKSYIREVAEKCGSLTLRFSHIYDNAVIMRVEQDRRLIAEDVVKCEGDLQRLVIKAMRLLGNTSHA